MKFEQFSNLIKVWENAECIYKESQIICHSRVTQIHADEQRMSAQLTLIPTPGFFPGSPSSKISAVWPYFSFDRNSWHTSMTGLVWEVYFEQDLIQEVIQIAQSFANELEKEERLYQFNRCLNEYHLRSLMNEDE